MSAPAVVAAIIHLTCVLQTTVAVNIEARQLGDGVDNLYATWKACEHFMSLIRRRKDSLLLLAEIIRKIWAEFLCKIRLQIIVTDR